MSDKRTPAETFDTGKPTARPRDDLRTANKKSKAPEQRNEGRDKKNTAQQKGAEEEESRGAD